MTDVLVQPGWSKEQALRLAASLEARSEHPLAQAILRGAQALNIRPLNVEDFDSVPGQGVSGRVDGQSVVLGNRRLMVSVEVSITTVQHDMEQLQAVGKTVMLLASGTDLVALIALADTVKPEAAQAIAGL
ncbi:MAG: HAD family hydrolase, partial [Burkholderiaceae bacterium]